MKRALERLPGVIEVTFESKLDTFFVTGTSELREGALRKAVLDQVVFARLRTLIGHLGARKVK